MKRVAAPLAAVLSALAIAGCGGGAEPGAPEGATLILDFTPNAVHSGIYAAQHRGYFEDAGVDLTIREPSATSDAPKLLEAGRADFAVMDINDLEIARERGIDLVAISAIVQSPLGSVIAQGDVRDARDLLGSSVGVTGVPSDDAVLDTVLRSGGLQPDDVDRVNIGFNAVPALAGNRVDAVTAFWNAEGVELKALGVPTREFRVDELGAGTSYRFPELVLVTTRDLYRDRKELACGVSQGLQVGYHAFGADPEQGLDDLLAENPDLDRDQQRAQLEALLAAGAFSGPGGGRFTSRIGSEGLFSWTEWLVRNGLVPANNSLRRASRPFSLDFQQRCVLEERLG